MRPINIPNKNGIASDNLAFSSSYNSSAVAQGYSPVAGLPPTTGVLDDSMSSAGAGSLDIEPASAAQDTDSADGNQRRSSLSLSKIEVTLEGVKEDQRKSKKTTTPSTRMDSTASVKASRSIKQHPSASLASSTEINPNQLSSTALSANTFDISSSLSTESSPLSSDVEDNNTKSEELNMTSKQEENQEIENKNDQEDDDEEDSFDYDDEDIIELTRDKKLLDKFNSDYDGQVEKIADKACDLIANGSFYDCGLYQFLSFVFLSIVWTVGTGWYAYISVFSGYTPEHQCSMGENYTMPGNESACWAVNIHTNETVECNHWTYDESQMKSTIITDHNFVCSKDYYFELGYTIEQIGYIVGTLIFSYIADVVGRKPVLVATLVSMCVLGFVQYALISSFSIYIALGFVINSLACGLEASCVTLVLEMFSTQKRTVFGIGIEIIWVLVIASMAPMAYVMKDWKEIRLAIFVLLAVLAVLSPWMSQESVRWLISMGKINSAEKIVNKIIKFNRLTAQVTLPGKAVKSDKQTVSPRQKLTRMLDALSLYNKLLAEQKLKPVEQREYTQPSVTTIKSMFSNSKFRLYVLIMALNWFATALVYDGLTYLNNFIGDNIFFSWIVMNLIELPAQFVCYFVISRYGRRLTVSLTLITSGISLLLTLVDMIPGLSGIEWMKIILFVLAKFTLTQSYSAVILHAPELFPTNMRSFGYGICLFSGKITSVMSPMISMYLGKIAPHLPAFIYGLISVLCGLLSLYVPETLNRPLPNSVDDVCKWPRSLTETEWQVVRDINKAEIDNIVNKLKAIGRKKMTETKRKRKTRVNPSMDMSANSNGANHSDAIVIENDELVGDKKPKYTVIPSSSASTSRSSEPSSPISVKISHPA